MPGFRTISSALGGVVGGRWLADDNRLVFVEWAGRIGSLDSMSGVLTTLGDGYVEPEDVVVAGDGQTLFVSQRNGDIIQAHLDAAAASSGSVLVSGLTAPHQMRLSEDGQNLYVSEYAEDGRLTRISLADGSRMTVTEGLVRPIGLALDEAAGRAYVSQEGNGGEILAIDIASGVTTSVTSGIGKPFFLDWASDGRSLLVTRRDPANSLVSIEVATGAPTEMGPVPFRPSMAVNAGGEILVLCDADIVGVVPLAKVGLAMPASPLFVGGYARVPVTLDNTGIDFDDLSFSVPYGPKGAAVSPSRDVDFDVTQPDVMLLAGALPGEYELVAMRISTGEVVARGCFGSAPAGPMRQTARRSPLPARPNIG